MSLTNSTRWIRPSASAATFAALALPAVLLAQAGAFSYQGQLATADGPVNGNCDFEFSLWTAETGGTQIGTDSAAGLAVSGGLFTAELDFGAGAFDGGARWLEVTVDCGDGPATLPPQQLTASPYSLTSLSTTGLQGRPVSEAAPATGEVLAWDGSEWAPAPDADAGGDITGVSAGEGLTGGGDSGAVSLAVDRGQVQSRVGEECAEGSSIRAIDEDGNVVCETDTDTTYDGGDFAMSDQSCPAGEVVSAVDPDGTVVCAPDADAGGDITGVSAGEGLTGGGDSGAVSLAVDRGQVQSRVGEECAEGSSIRAIDEDGNVVCETDTDTTYDGSNFALSGRSCIPGRVVRGVTSSGEPICQAVSTGDIIDATVSASDIDSNEVQERVSGTCSAGNIITAINADGSVDCAAAPGGVSGFVRESQDCTMSASVGTFSCAAIASCDTGKVAVGGGAFTNCIDGFVLDYPSGAKDSWQGIASSVDADCPADPTLTVYAVCVDEL